LIVDLRFLIYDCEPAHRGRAAAAHSVLAGQAGARLNYAALISPPRNCPKDQQLRDYSTNNDYETNVIGRKKFYKNPSPEQPITRANAVCRKPLFGIPLFSKYFQPFAKIGSRKNAYLQYPGN
jgi:hypothetical protein